MPRQQIHEMFQPNSEASSTFQENQKIIRSLPVIRIVFVILVRQAPLIIRKNRTYSSKFTAGKVFNPRKSLLLPNAMHHIEKCLSPGFIMRKISLKTTCSQGNTATQTTALKEKRLCSNGNLNQKSSQFDFWNSRFDQASDTLLPRRQLRRKSCCNERRMRRRGKSWLYNQKEIWGGIALTRQWNRVASWNRLAETPWHAIDFAAGWVPYLCGRARFTLPHRIEKESTELRGGTFLLGTHLRWCPSCSSLTPKSLRFQNCFSIFSFGIYHPITECLWMM
jgi:hypothetical protein